MENNKTNYYVDNCFDMELISKSGKLLGKGQVNIEHSFMHAKFCDKSHKKNFDFKISLKDILVVKEVDGTSDELIVEIHYIKHELHRLLKMESIRFRAGASEATYFHILMDDVIQGFSRPRKLLVFINPISGRKKGLKIYRQQMAPICKLCGIECSVIVTNRRGQALEILDNYDLSSIDGIVTVGGDGIFSECVNGLLRRHQAEHNVDIHDTNSRLQPCNIPLGVLPAGSGNVLLELLHGNKDVQTAVLRIILGDVTRTNVAGVYQGGVLSVYACLILGFGLCGRMVRDCEKTRWMGPRRYSIAPLKALLTRKMYDVEVSLLKKDNESFIKKSNRIVTRTKSYDVRMGKSSVRKQKQHLVINRSKSLDIYENSKFHAIERGRVSLKSRVFSNVSATSQTRRNSVFKSSNRIASNHEVRVSYKHKNTVSDINNQPINSVQSSLHVNGSIKRTYSGQNNLFRTNERVDKVYPNSQNRGRNTHIANGLYSDQESSDDIINFLPDDDKENYVIRDRVYSIDTWIPTLTDISDQCHPVFGDSKITAHCVKECSFGDHLKHLLKVNERVAYCFKFDFVHALRGRGYKVRIFDTGDSRHRRKYYINYDGDSLLLKSSEFDVRLHRNIIKLFGTKEEDDKT
ncbi:CERK [Mytilus edulis]|uniref:CERK n=1 Tax=Mytilus edulis TaxID=6550 RepID=A0A8S3Q666_MYTED|nr:CERK [Mytilus edulis]